MEMKTNGYIDLRQVPNEIIIGAYSAVCAGYWAGVDELFNNNKPAFDKFKLVVNPCNFKIIYDRKKEILDSTAHEIFALAEKFSIVSDEYIKQHADIIKTTKYKIAELDKIQQLHEHFYQQIEAIMKKESWLQEKKPLLVRGHNQVVIINDGNAVYVEHRDVNNNFNVLYCEANHKEIVDNLLNEIYTTCESSETIEVQTMIPAENE